MSRVYAFVILGLTLQIMSVASLLALSFSNPGFVSDYFISRKVPQLPSLSDEEERLEDG